ncbi:uncharacterized protein LOC116917982 isoform X3 [Daphnia magna]|uniref:uncharacterized protein LOC116917982 isoform X3 n=2 Tax=Daphnia magna TaxID=35525 RepID=UPI0006E89744|nr:uncharacterized protein LOC116917982 isoform X3 [Daphnia magna]
MFLFRNNAHPFCCRVEPSSVAIMKPLQPLSTVFLLIVSIVTFASSTIHEKEKDISSELGIAALALTAEDYASSVQRSDDNDGGGTSRHTMTDAAAINLAERSPRFEDASGHANVTVQLGDTAFLNCKVLDLQDKTQVSWVRRHEQELHLLTVGMQTYSTDSRFSLHFQHPNDWRLQIKFARPRDEGIYECQVSIHPPRIYTVRLIVAVPSVEMVDDHGRVIEEKIYKTGSTIELKCVVSKVPGPTANIMWRHGLRILNYDTSRGGISVKTDLLPYGAVSRLYIANASQRDAGNYTCNISESSWTTVVVHILNGEHPAAMQHGQSSSSERRPLVISMLVVVMASWFFMWKCSFSR